MAQTHSLAPPQIDSRLRYLEALFHDLAIWTTRWASLDEDMQVDFSLDWDVWMDRFEALVDLDASCHFGREQHSRLVAVIQTYERIMPIAERLELYTIPVPAIPTE